MFTYFYFKQNKSIKLIEELPRPLFEARQETTSLPTEFMMVRLGVMTRKKSVMQKLCAKDAADKGSLTNT
jgi:hypothetical protein